MQEYKPFEIKHYIVFDVAGKKFAFDILDIDSIHTSSRKHDNDDMSDLKTAVRLYKKLVPIVNLRRKFGLDGEPCESKPTIVFLKRKNQIFNDIIGVQVDQTLDYIETMVNPSSKSGKLVKMIAGVRSEVVQILHINDVMEETERAIEKTEVMN